MNTTKQRRKGRISPWINRGRLFFALLALAALVAMLGSLAGTAQAQTYRFGVTRSTTDLFVNEDGTVTVEYLYVFANDRSADPIDAVDIGVPTSDYDLSSVSGSVNGRQVTDIEESPYVHPGVALNLRNLAIAPGQTGEVRVRIGVVRGLLFKANMQEQVQEPYASFQFNPNYFGSEFVRGSTDMTVTLHLPPGLTQDEPRYFNPGGWPGSKDPDEAGYDDQNRVYYTWRAPNASSSEAYTFGAAFPARLVPAAALLTESPVSRFNFGAIFDNLCPFLFCAGIAGFFGLTIWGSIVGDRNRKMKYLPPKVAVEGNGIKRGLTAPEAAVLMEQPMDKVLTMILFSTIKKGAAQVTSRTPLQVRVNAPRPEGLQAYEAGFLEAMELPAGAQQRRKLQDMMTDLVKSVSEKMRGFSRRETVAFYQDIMKRAWAQVQSAQTPEMQVQAIDESMEWTMLDRNYDQQARQVFGPRPVFLPDWWYGWDPGMARPTASAGGGVNIPNVSTGQNRPPTGMSMPSLPGGDFAASVVGGMQNFASNVVGDLTAFTGGVTEKTNPVPKTPTRSGGGGGGRSGGCACACACAGCACACAGGGR